MIAALQDRLRRQRNRVESSIVALAWCIVELPTQAGAGGAGCLHNSQEHITDRSHTPNKNASESYHTIMKQEPGGCAKYNAVKSMQIFIYIYICSAPPPGPTFFRYKTIYIC